MAAVPTPQALCGGWEGAATALKAPGDCRRIGYLVTPGRPGDAGAKTEVHVWGDPKPGDPHQCGKQRWD